MKKKNQPTTDTATDTATAVAAERPAPQVNTLEGDMPSNMAENTQPVSLSIEDLKNVLQIFDVASTRGTFKAPEMAPVGILYNKIATFVAAYEKNMKDAETQANAPKK